MHTLRNSTLAAVIVLFLAGCSTTSSFLRTGDHFAPLEKTATVRVYTGEIPSHFHEIGMLTVDLPKKLFSDDATKAARIAVTRGQQYARSVGGDILYLKRVKNQIERQSRVYIFVVYRNTKISIKTTDRQ